MPEPRSEGQRTRLTRILVVVFLAALFLGPGPGIQLINPDKNADPASMFVLGVPVIYAWGILTYFVLLGCVLTAFFTIWADDVRDETG